MKFKKIFALLLLTAVLFTTLFLWGCNTQPNENCSESVSNADNSEQSASVPDDNDVLELYDPALTTECGYLQAVIVKWGKQVEDRTDAVNGYVFIEAEVVKVFEGTFLGSKYLGLGKKIGEYKKFLIPIGLTDFVSEGNTDLIFVDMILSEEGGDFGIRSGGTGALVIPVEENKLVISDELFSVQNHNDLDALLSGNEYIKDTLYLDGPLFQNGMTVEELEDFFTLVCKILDE
ncbi:MAG: hypothetical protein IKC06_01045 [Clostridia bacterium]|nr:hypothetical protein [Clostridia bacterium]